MVLYSPLCWSKPVIIFFCQVWLIDLCIYNTVKVIESVLDPTDFNFTKMVENSIKNIIFWGPHNEKLHQWWLNFNFGVEYPFKKLKCDFILTPNSTNATFLIELD